MEEASRSAAFRLVLLSAVAAAGSLAVVAPAAAQTSAGARNVTLRLSYMPEGVTTARGALLFTVRGIASGWAVGEPMKGLAKRLEAPIIMVAGGDDLNDNSYPNRCASGEFNGIGEAMAKLGTASNHPELANVPLVGIGHSHGGDYWNWYTACHPEKMAAVFVHASGGVNYSAASLQVPVIYELGTGDLIENGSKKPRAGMFVNRAKGAPMALVIGQGEGHNQVTAASLAMIIDIVEGVFKLRVPADADASKGPVALVPIDESRGWLGNLYTKEIAPHGSYTGNKALTSFLPSEEIARKWKETGPGLPVSITLPSDTCSWCGTPKDEPKGGAVPPSNSGPAPDAGAPPTSDAATAPPVTPPGPPLAGTGGSGGAGAPPSSAPAGSGGASGSGSGSAGSNGNSRPTATAGATGAGEKPVVGGCSFAAGDPVTRSPRAAGLGLLVAGLALVAVRARRRR